LFACAILAFENNITLAMIAITAPKNFTILPSTFTQHMVWDDSSIFPVLQIGFDTLPARKTAHA
jgi:hypothetical protein